MATTTVGIKLDATVSGADQVKKLKDEIKAAEAEAKKISKEFGASSVEAQKAAEKVTKLAQGLDSFKSIKTQIREATQEAVRLAQQFGEFSPEATKAAQRVAELKDTMQDFQQRVQALNPDKFEAVGKMVGGIASGFSAAQGAMALFGAESEDVQKTLLKVQGAMALAQGIQGVIDAQKQFKVFGQGAVAAFQGMTTASKAFMATGLGLILTAIAAVVSYWDDIKGAISGVSAEQEKLNAQTQANLETNKAKLDAIDKSENILKLQGKSEKEIRQMKLDQLKLTIANAETNVKNAKITKQAQVEAAKSNKEFLKGILDFISKPLQLVIDTVTGIANYFGADWDFNLAESIAGAIFDPEETAKEGDKVIAEAEATLMELKNQQAGIILSIQKENQEAAKAASDKQKKINEDRAKADADYAQQTAVTLNERLKAFEKAWAIELQGEAKKNLTKEQLEKEYALRRQAIIDKNNAEREAAQKAATEKEIAETTKATDQFFKTEQEKVLGNDKALAQLEVQRLEAQLQNARDYGQSTVDLELALAQKKKEIRDKDVAEAKAAEEAKQAAQIETLKAAASAISALGGLFKEGSDAAKAAALADIAINTGIGFVQGLDIAQKGAKATGPAAPYAFPIFYATQIAAVLGAASRARAIMKAGSGSGASGGGGAAGVPAAPSFTPTAGGALPEEGQFGGMGRVYVLEGDITKTQTRVRRLRNTSVV